VCWIACQLIPLLPEEGKNHKPSPQHTDTHTNTQKPRLQSKRLVRSQSLFLSLSLSHAASYFQLACYIVTSCFLIIFLNHVS
jgi:hypothetical protein